MAYLVGLAPGRDAEASLLRELVGMWPPAATGPMLVVELGQSGEPTDPDEVARFLQSVGAFDDIVVVVVAGRWAGAAALASGLVGQLRGGAQVLSGLRCWVVGDAGPQDTDALHPALVALLGTAPDLRLRGVAVIPHTTSRKAQTVTVDRTAMLADTVWALTCGGLALDANEFECPGAWWTTTLSFTSWAPRVGSAKVAEAMLAALTGPGGPLQAESAGSLDKYTRMGAQWVEDRKIGTEQEYRALTTCATGDLFEILAMPDSSAELRPDAWAAGIDREYLVASGVPLARFRRTLKANARELLEGPRESPDSGHLRALRAAVDKLLREPAGIKRTARFLNGVTAALQARATDVGNAARTTADQFDPPGRRRRLVNRVGILPDSRPWLVGSVPLICVATVAVTGLSPLAAAIGAAAATGGLGLGVGSLRYMANRGRVGYLQEAAGKLRAIGDEAVHAQWAAMIRQLADAAGEFIGEMHTQEEIEDAILATPGSLAAELSKLRKLLLGVTADLRAAQVAVELSHPAVEGFAVFYPDTPAEVAALTDIDSRISQAACEDAKTNVADSLRDLSLDDGVPELCCQRIRDLLAPPVWTLASLAEDVDAARAEAVAVLEQANLPAVPVDPACHAAATHMLCGPPAALHWLPGADRQRASDDHGRAVRVWVQPLPLALTGPEPIEWPVPEPEPVPVPVPGDPEEIGA